VVKAEREGKLYAIKALINREELADSSNLHFKLETEILRRARHPQIPRFVEAFSFDGVDYIVQEYIKGLPLSCLVDKGTRFSEAEAKEILSQILLILNVLHKPKQKKNAIIHRDLRLSNLLFEDGKIFLVDFGLARFLDPTQFPYCPDVPGSYHSNDSDEDLLRVIKLRSQKKPGIETYRILRKEISPRSDLFGVGVVAVDLFASWVEDDSLFDLPWENVLPLSDPFIVFLHKLLSREGGFDTAEDAVKYLNTI
jgi:serine/threonine protein kinase